MKYTIETTENGCVETLEMNDGTLYIKRYTKTSSGLRQEDTDFATQLEDYGVCDDEFLDKVYDTFDGFLALNFMDIDKMF